MRYQAVTDEMGFTFAAKLKEILIDRQWTSKKLASVVGVSEARVSNYLNAKTTPSIDTIRKFSEALNIPYEEMIMSKNRPPEAAGMFSEPAKFIRIPYYGNMRRGPGYYGDGLPKMILSEPHFPSNETIYFANSETDEDGNEQLWIFSKTKKIKIGDYGIFAIIAEERCFCAHVIDVGNSSYILTDVKTRRKDFFEANSVRLLGVALRVQTTFSYN